MFALKSPTAGLDKLKSHFCYSAISSEPGRLSKRTEGRTAGVSAAVVSQGNRFLKRVLASLVTLAIAGAAQGAGQAILTPDTTNFFLIAVSPLNGAPISFSTKPLGRWLDLSVTIDSSTIGSLRHALQIGSEVWVTDQLSSIIYRYSAQSEKPRYLGSISSVFNPRGMGVVNGEMWVACGDTGSGPGIARFTPGGQLIGSFAAEDPFAVLELDGTSALTSNIQQNRLDRFGTTGPIGNSLGVWSGTSNLDFPMQITRWLDAGVPRILTVGFSGNDPGLYVYDPATGAYVKRLLTIAFLPEVTVVNPRGAAPLQNGEILWTGSQGIFALNVTTMTSRVIYTGDNFVCAYSSPVDFTKYCPGDINNDSLVDDADFSVFAAAYNDLLCPTLDSGYPAGCPADLNGDGMVDDLDFTIFASAYNELLCP